MGTMTEQAERLLIYENTQQIEAITSEIQQRASMLNKLVQAGLTNKEINEITVSANSIETYIFQRHLEANNELKKLHTAGIEVKAQLPQDLAAKKYLLLAWFNYSKQGRGGDKFENLVYTNVWKSDEQALELLFIRNRLKFYVEGEQLNEFKEIEAICRYFEAYRMPNNQIKESSFLWQKIEPIGMHQFKPRWTYFAQA